MLRLSEYGASIGECTYHPRNVCAQTAPTSDLPGPPGPPRARRGPGITPIQWVGLAVLIGLLLYQMGLLSPTATGSNGLLARLPFFVALVLAITVHEFSHGLVATFFGDDLPRRVGRLTLNPLKHLDPIGTLMILIGPIGWGRPMPINPRAMRNPNLGWALSSLAGPVSNILAALAVLLVAWYGNVGVDRSLLTLVLNYGLNALRLIDLQAVPLPAQIVLALIGVNLALAIFNLLPVPPLDGFGIVFGLAPRPIKIALLPLQRYGPLILIAVLFLPVTQPYLSFFLFRGQALVGRFLGGLAGVT